MSQKIKQLVKLPLIKVNKVRNIIRTGLDANFPEEKLKRLTGVSHNCSGTTSIRERLFIYDEAYSSIKIGRFLEVGSYLGASAIVLAEALRRQNSSSVAKLYCIDTWKNDAMSEGARDTYQLFQENIQPWAELIEPIRGNSTNILIPFDGFCDLVFIDADHSYEGCRCDVERFAPLVREGGCLILDDHISFPGVTRVVGELLQSGSWYVSGAYHNVISLCRDERSFGKPRRKRVGNRVLHP